MRQQPTPILPSTGFLRLNQVLQFVPIGKTAWHRWNATYPHAILSPAVGQKDLGEMHAAALRLGPEPTIGEWCAAALSLAHKMTIASRRNAETQHSDPLHTNQKKEAT